MWRRIWLRYYYHMWLSFLLGITVTGSSPAVRLFQHFTENQHPSSDDRLIMKKERGRETKKIKDETWMDLNAVYLVIVKAWFSSITFRNSCRKKEKHEETVNKSDRPSQEWSHKLKKKSSFYRRFYLTLTTTPWCSKKQSERPGGLATKGHFGKKSYMSRKSRYGIWIICKKCSWSGWLE